MRADRADAVFLDILIDAYKHALKHRGPYYCPGQVPKTPARSFLGFTEMPGITIIIELNFS